MIPEVPPRYGSCSASYKAVRLAGMDFESLSQGRIEKGRAMTTLSGDPGWISGGQLIGSVMEGWSCLSSCLSSPIFCSS